jgi:hypothetical protein
MFRLTATLVTTTRMRPWRTGWSFDRGVDIRLPATARPASAAPTGRSDSALVERACFIDDDRAGPVPASAAARTTPETPACDAPEAPGIRAWWSVSGKPSRT